MKTFHTYIKDNKSSLISITEKFRISGPTKTIYNAKDEILSKINFDGDTLDDWFTKCKTTNILSDINELVCRCTRSDSIRMTEKEWEAYNEFKKILEQCADLWDCDEDTTIFDALSDTKLEKTFVFRYDNDNTVFYYKSDNAILVCLFAEITKNADKFYFGITF